MNDQHENEVRIRKLIEITSKQSKRLKECESVVRRFKKIKHYIVKRKSAFGVYEWLEIESLIRIVE